MPVHLHMGRPTPWSEGIVVRVDPDHSEAWTVNAQGGDGYTSKIVEWGEARCVVLIAKGACYLIRPDAHAEWQLIEPWSSDCLLTPDQTLALILTFDGITVLSQKGHVEWRRSLGIDGIEITHLTKDIIEGVACIDPPDDWVPFRIRTRDGADVGDPSRA